MLLRSALLLVLFCGSSGPVVAAPSESKDLTVKLNERVHNYNLGTFTFVGALIRVSSDFQIPMGIEWVNTSAARAELTFAWKEASVGQIIEAIAKTQPGCQVEVANGVVHVIGMREIPDAENFLRLHIKNLRVDNDLTEIASWRLHSLVAPARHSGFSTAANVEPRISLDLKDCTVEGALDALVLASKRKIWIVTFWNDASVTSKGLRRAMSLWSDKPAPDEEQPVWDLLHWGDPLPPLAG